jgi:predicted transcriptional regulator
MEVKLSPELERKVHELAGEHRASPSEIVAQALKAFFGHDNMTTAETEDLNRSIDKGLAEARSGFWVEGHEAREAAILRLKSRRGA